MTIKGLISAYRDELNISVEDVAEYCGISRNEYYKKLKNPNKWRLGELNAAYDFLNIPKEERLYE